MYLAGSDRRTCCALASCSAVLVLAGQPPCFQGTQAPCAGIARVGGIPQAWLSHLQPVASPGRAAVADSGAQSHQACPTLPNCPSVSPINDGSCLKPLNFEMVCYPAVRNQDIGHMKSLRGCSERMYINPHKTYASLTIALVITVTR